MQQSHNSRAAVAPAIVDVAGLRRHYMNVIVPMWRERGFDAGMGLPVEAVMMAADVAPPLSRFRAMACARQLFVFAEIGDVAHARQLFDSLIGHFSDVDNGGFFFSITPSGTPLDTDKDLYTHAFVIFACSAYFRLTRDDRALETINTTIDIVENRFPRDFGSHLPVALCDRTFAQTLTGPRQNPLMHLTEAYLEARSAGNSTYLDRTLGTLLKNVTAAFIDAETHCVMELPIIGESVVDNWIEPGHQFEWYFLCWTASQAEGLDGGPQAAFESSGMRAHLEHAFAFAERYGVRSTSGGVVASVNRAGDVVDPNQRIWAQTEYLRALACHSNLTKREALSDQIIRFASRFLHSDGWHEMLSDDGRVIRNEMPSTTAYHLASAYMALP